MRPTAVRWAPGVARMTQRRLGGLRPPQNQGKPCIDRLAPAGIRDEQHSGVTFATENRMLKEVFARLVPLSNKISNETARSRVPFVPGRPSKDRVGPKSAALLEDLLRSGDDARSEKNWKAAEVAYGAVLKNDPTLQHIWVQYGHALKEQGAFHEAEEAYRRSLKIGDENADAYLQLGHALKLQGKMEAAGRAYREAFAREPNNPHILAELNELNQLGQVPLELFDSDWYASQNPETNGNRPLDHYISVGRNRGLMPTPVLQQIMEKGPSRIPLDANVNIPMGSSFFNSLKWLDSDSPEVSLVILSYRRPDLVENLIRSVWLFTTNVKYELIVVDNGSPAGEHRLASPYRDRARIITLASNRYIGDAYNIGVERAKGKFVVLMNNDIVVQPEWLRELIDVLRNDTTIGVVGPKFLYPGGMLQEAGALIDNNGYSVQLGKRGDANSPEFNILREVDYCTGATFACRRDLFIEVLGYDWRWDPGYYEDSDFCFKVRELGLKVIYAPKSVVFHLESATMSTLPPTPHIGERIADNRKKFVEKWRDVLGTTGRFGRSLGRATNLRRVRQIENFSRCHIEAVAAFFPFDFIPGGGEKYMLTILETFSSTADIYLIFPSEESLFRIISVVNELGLPSLDFGVMTWRQAEAFSPFDKFFMLGNELFPSRRGLGKRNFFNCQFPHPTTHEFLSFCYNSKFHESYECYLVNSHFTEKFVVKWMSDWHSDVAVKVLWPTTELIGPGAQKGNDVIGVGRFFVGGHNKRHDKMIEALEILNQLAPSLEATLHLAGAVHRESIHKEHLRQLRVKSAALKVHFYTDVHRPDLNMLYQKCKVYWHAAGWGVDAERQPERAEHFGITIIEAMSAGCIPIVFSVGGPLDIVKHGLNGFAVGSIEEMAEFTARVLQDWDTPFIMRMRDHALATASCFGKEAFQARLKEAIPETA